MASKYEDDGEKIKKIESRLEYLSEQDDVKYWIRLNQLPQEKRREIIDSYDKYLKNAKTSIAGMLYQSSRLALKNKDMVKLKENGAIARQMLVDGDYEMDQEFDPKYVGARQNVMQYRELMAIKTRNIPEKFKEALL